MGYLPTAPQAVESSVNSSTSDVGGTSTLATSINTTDTSIVVASGHGSRFPEAGIIQIADGVNTEFITYTSKSTDTLTLAGVGGRGNYTTTAASFTSGSSTIITGIFVGTGEQNHHPDVLVSLKSDVGGTLYFDFSIDGAAGNWDTFPVTGFTVAANIHEFHTAVKGSRYFRTRFLSGGTAATTSFRVKTQFGTYRQGNLPLNQSIGADSDSSIVRAVSTNADPNGTYVNGMASNLVTNNSTTTTLGASSLNGDLTDVATSVILAASHGFADGDYMLVETEIILLGAESPTNTFACTRAQLGTTAAAHNNDPGAGHVFVGTWQNVAGFHGISVLVDGTAATLAPGNLWMQFSHDGATVHRSISIAVADVTNTPSRTLGVISKCFRTIYGTTVTHTSTDIQTMFHTQQVQLVGRLNATLQGNEDVTIVRSITAGQQPDGDFVNAAADGNAFATTATLGVSGTYSSVWTDTDGFNTIEIFCSADVASATDGIIVEFTNDSGVTSPTVQFSITFTFTATDVAKGHKDFIIGTHLDGFRVRFVNGTTGQSSFRLEAQLRVNGVLDTQKVNAAISDDAESILVRSVQIGKQPQGTYSNSLQDGYAFRTTSTLAGTLIDDVSGYTDSVDNQNFTVDDSSSFGASGYIYIGSEIIQYTSKPSDTTLAIPSGGRGQFGTTAAAISDNAVVGEIFVSDILTLDGYTEVATKIVSSHDGKPRFQWYSDSAGTDTIRTVGPVYAASSGYDYLAAPNFGPYVRYMFAHTPSTGVDQTDFYFETEFYTKSISAQVLTLNSTLLSNMTSNVTRSVLVGQQAGSTTFQNVATTANGELLTNTLASNRSARANYNSATVSADTYVLMVDVSDTVNYPHSETNEIIVDAFSMSIAFGSNTSSATIRLGVITAIDGTDADISYLITEHPSVQSANESVHLSENVQPSGIVFRVEGGSLSGSITNDTATAVTAVNTGITLASTRGVNVTPAVGDVVAFLDHSTGDDFVISIGIVYHSN